MDTDHPYVLTVDDDGSLVEIPIQWALDDWEQYCYIPQFSGSVLIEIPTKAIEMWRLEFDAIRTEGGCFVLTNHPFLSWRPSRAAALDELIEYVGAQDDLWVASLGEIATHVRGLGLTPRSVQRPNPADFQCSDLHSFRSAASGYLVGMSATDKAKNKIEDLAGKAKEAVGSATGDDSTRNEGRTDQAKSSLKDAGEKVKDAFKK